MNWLIARLKEPSSWRGIIWIATAFGVTLKPEIWEQITAVGMAVAGLIGVLTSEKPTTVGIQLPPIELQSHYTGQHSIVSTTTDDPVVSTPNRRSADAGRMQYVQPDYSPKEPSHPVDQQSGWNG